MACLVVEQGDTLQAAAIAFHVSEKSAAKWVRRFRLFGPAGLENLRCIACATGSRSAPGPVSLLHWRNSSRADQEVKRRGGQTARRHIRIIYDIKHVSGELAELIPGVKIFRITG